jgi:hypothetical protein
MPSGSRLQSCQTGPCVFQADYVGHRVVWGATIESSSIELVLAKQSA